MGGLLRLPGVDVNGEMLPTDFDDAKRQHEWPYRSFDGRYEDRALHLAVRCRDEAGFLIRRLQIEFCCCLPNFGGFRCSVHISMNKFRNNPYARNPEPQPEA